jgi:hypothetical protein
MNSQPASSDFGSEFAPRAFSARCLTFHAMSRARRWVADRFFALLASTVLLVVGMASTIWWGPHFVGSTQWQLPDDLWGTLVAARRLEHLHLGGLYTSPTGLVSFPGTALVLVPLAALMGAAGFSFATPGPQDPHPATWVVAGPYEIALSATVLFAADAIARRCGVSRPKRFVLAAFEGVALWNVSVRWGHPEDAVAVALLLYALLARSKGSPEKAAWLLGCAIAVQPLVLLAVPVMVVAVEGRKVVGFLLRAAVVPVAVLAPALATNWAASTKAVGNQPNWPSVDHRTPWTSLSPHLSHGAVAAGPARAVAIVLACICALVAERAHEGGVLKAPTWSPETFERVLWWTAVTLSLRCVFEAVMVAYYVWPALAVGLLSASLTWKRILAAGVVSCALTFLSQLPWKGAFGWWAMVLFGLTLVLVFSRAFRRRPAAQPPRAAPTAVVGTT